MSSLPVFLRPSTKITEIDLTQRLQVIESTTGAVVGEFARGPVKPTYQSGIDEDFRKLYGQIADPTISFAHDTCTLFSTQSANLLVNRVTKDAKYATISLLKDPANKSIIMYNGGGTDTDADEEGLNTYFLLQLDADLVAANVIEVDITDGVSVETASVSYSSSHTATFNAFANAVQVALNTFGVGCVATVLPYDTTPRSILVKIGKTLSLDMDGFLVTLGASQAGTEIVEDAHLGDFFAENPGSWANDYGILLKNIDTGVRSRFRLTLAGPLVSSNVIAVTVNGVSVSTTFNTDSDTTLENFATALQNNPDISSAVVETVPGGINNDRSILIVASKPGPDQVEFGPVSVTAGSSQTTGIINAVMTGVPADNTFTVEVYNRSNLNRSEERFVVSFNKQLSSFGYQQNIEHVVNKASGRSINVRFRQAPASLTGSIYDDLGTPYTVPSTVLFLQGGDDGVAVTSAEIRQGWLDIEDRAQYPVDILLNAGYTGIAVQKEMAALAERRFDCMAILDAPSDMQAAQDLFDYRNNELDLDTSYAAMYTPDIEIEDMVTGERRYVPPSGLIGATYAYSDRLTSAIGAPAGLNRGRITLAVGLRHRYTPAQEELLFPNGINCIIDRLKSGPTVMGEETLQVKKTILSSVHARRILNRIKVGLVDGLDYTLFEPNTEWTRRNAIQLGDGLLKPMKKGDGSGGVYDYRIKCDADNNPPEVIDAEILNYDVYLKLMQVIKGVNVRAILTRTGASFEEIIVDLDF